MQRVGFLSIMRILVLGAIYLYQNLVSPFLPGSCRFYPSCSEYAAQALQTHGALYGIVLSVWRVLRCQPLARGGLDPVPGCVQDNDRVSDQIPVAGQQGILSKKNNIAIDESKQK